MRLFNAHIFLYHFYFWTKKWFEKFFLMYCSDYLSPKTSVDIKTNLIQAHNNKPPLHKIKLFTQQIYMQTHPHFTCSLHVCQTNLEGNSYQFLILHPGSALHLLHYLKHFASGINAICLPSRACGTHSIDPLQLISCLYGT